MGLLLHITFNYQLKEICELPNGCPDGKTIPIVNGKIFSLIKFCQGKENGLWCF